MPNHDTPQLEDVTFTEVWKEYMIDEIERLSNDGRDEPGFAQQFDLELKSASEDEGVRATLYSHIDHLSCLELTRKPIKVTWQANDGLDVTLWSHHLPFKSPLLPAPDEVHGTSPYTNSSPGLRNGNLEMTAFTSLPAMTFGDLLGNSETDLRQAPSPQVLVGEPPLGKEEMHGQRSGFTLLAVGSGLDEVPASNDSPSLSKSPVPLHTKMPGSASRLSTKAISILQDWLIRHHLDPYPNRNEKCQLADLTGLSIHQVSCWFSRTRSRKMQMRNLAEDVGAASLPDTPGFMSPISTNEDVAKAKGNTLHSPPKMIPSSENDHGGFGDAAGERDVVNNASPMQRFLSTPPEADPAPLEAIKRAAATTPWNKSERSPKRRHFWDESSFTASSSSFEKLITRYDAPRTDKGYDSVSLSNGSISSSVTSQDSTASHASWSGRQGRERHRVSVGATREHHPERKFACTWCRKAFKRAYEWQRHEESQHAPQTEFVCFKAIPERKCAFCRFGANIPDMDLETLKRHYVMSHNAELCFSKSSEKKAFDRKDHLMQHIRQVHVSNISIIQSGFKIDSKVLYDWQQPIQNSIPEHGWTCGFCHENFRDWMERVSHVKTHFESGLDIQYWTLDPNALGLSRPSRTTVEHQSYGCASCLRSFSSFNELRDHEALPHLNRSAWTCTDLLAGAVSHGSLENLLSVAPGLLSETFTLSDACLMCPSLNERIAHLAPVELTETDIIVAYGTKVIRYWHWGLRHGLARCDAIFYTLYDFERHLEAIHKGYKVEVSNG
jgi:hypothetical protein